VLRAVGKNNAKETASDELRTAGAPAKIILTTDGDSVPNNWDGVCFVTATIVDDKGVICPFADDVVTFAVKGPGVIARVDNALDTSSEPFASPQRPAHEGHVVAMIKASAPTGLITITASAPGIANGSATITATP
jgi:beta-galactosidase